MAEDSRKERIYCFYCQRVGHMKRTCPNLSCFYCGGNHMKKHCIKYLLELKYRRWKKLDEPRVKELKETKLKCMEMEKKILKEKEKMNLEKLELEKRLDRSEKDVLETKKKLNEKMVESKVSLEKDKMMKSLEDELEKMKKINLGLDERVSEYENQDAFRKIKLQVEGGLNELSKSLNRSDNYFLKNKLSKNELKFNQLSKTKYVTKKVLNEMSKVKVRIEKMIKENEEEIRNREKYGKKWEKFVKYLNDCGVTPNRIAEATGKTVGKIFNKYQKGRLDLEIIVTPYDRNLDDRVEEYKEKYRYLFKNVDEDELYEGLTYEQYMNLTVETSKSVKKWSKEEVAADKEKFKRGDLRIMIEISLWHDSESDEFDYGFLFL